MKRIEQRGKRHRCYNVFAFSFEFLKSFFNQLGACSWSPNSHNLQLHSVCTTKFPVPSLLLSRKKCGK